MTTCVDTPAIETLRHRLGPARVVTDNPGLDAASAVWNGEVRHRAAAVVRPATTTDVADAVRAARASGLPLSVRGGGHDWAGRAVRPGGLVVDLTDMRQVTVRDGVATVGGGATVADVAEAADRHGLAVAAGTVSDVGMVGLLLGGGYGPFAGRFGLASDNLLAAEVVLGDGRVVHTGDDPELLWALRGGGGNFGVVTSVELALHPVPELLVGSYTFTRPQIGSVLTGLADLLDRAPDELVVVATIVTTPEGDPALMLSPTWAGAPDAGRPVLGEIAALGVPVAAETDVVSPLTKLRAFDGAFPAGGHYAVRTRTVAAFTPDVVAALLETYATRTTPGAFINVHHCHGAATRVAPEQSAFGERRAHHVLELLEIAGADAPLSDWTRRACAMLAPHALPGGYPNLLGPDDRAQAAAAYGPNASRLLAVKRRVDPDGVFSATPLPTEDHVG